MSTLSAIEAKNKRKTTKATATRLKNFLDSSGPNQLLRFDLTERIKNLSILWNQYDEVQSRIEALDFANIGDDTTTLHKQHNDEQATFELPYFNLVSHFETVLRNSIFVKIRFFVNSIFVKIRTSDLGIICHNFVTILYHLRLDYLKLNYYHFQEIIKIGTPFMTHLRN